MEATVTCNTRCHPNGLWKLLFPMHLSTNFYLQTPPQEHLAVWELHTSPTVRVEPLQPNGCGKDIKSYQETKGFAEQSQPCTSFFPNFCWGQLDRGRAMVGKLSWCAHREQGCSWPRWGCELCFNTTQTPRAKRSLKVTQEMTKRERKQRSEGARPKKQGFLPTAPTWLPVPFGEEPSKKRGRNATLRTGLAAALRARKPRGAGGAHRAAAPPAEAADEGISSANRACSPRTEAPRGPEASRRSHTELRVPQGPSTEGRGGARPSAGGGVRAARAPRPLTLPCPPPPTPHSPSPPVSLSPVPRGGSALTTRDGAPRPRSPFPPQQPPPHPRTSRTARPPPSSLPLSRDPRRRAQRSAGVTWCGRSASAPPSPLRWVM